MPRAGRDERPRDALSIADVPSTGVGAVIGAELPALLAQLRAAIRAGCPATVESDRRDQGITGCLELDRAGRLPI